MRDGTPMKINTEIVIHANIAKVWQSLTDFQNYPNSNPFMTCIEGEKKAGAKIKVEIIPPGSKPMTFTPKLIKFETNQEMRWIGILGASWLFSGEHYFKLEKLNEEKTKLTHGETFTDLISPIFSALSGKKTLQGFNLMNEGLKAWVESTN